MADWNATLKAPSQPRPPLSSSEKATPSYSSLTAATSWGWLLPKRNWTLSSATKVQRKLGFSLWPLLPALTPVCLLYFRHPLQENTRVVLRQQDGSAGRHDLRQGLPDVVFGEHSRQTVAHLVRFLWSGAAAGSFQEGHPDLQLKDLKRSNKQSLTGLFTSWAHSSAPFHDTHYHTLQPEARLSFCTCCPPCSTDYVMSGIRASKVITKGK